MDSVELLKTESGARLKKLSLTPQQIEGPFYPAEGLVAAGTDLTQLKNSDQIAKGQIIVIEGRVTDQFGQAVGGALVEIWQACHTGRYHHPADPNPAELDPHFQYWGQSVTDADGHYRFRTIIPGEYPAEEDWKRPPHIHFKISKKN
ncbi:MAG: dioxygenase family protein, partial [Pseudobdellovibrio sp.]